MTRDQKRVLLEAARHVEASWDYDVMALQRDFPHAKYFLDKRKSLEKKLVHLRAAIKGLKD